MESLWVRYTNPAEPQARIVCHSCGKTAQVITIRGPPPALAMATCTDCATTRDEDVNVDLLWLLDTLSTTRRVKILNDSARGTSEMRTLEQARADLTNHWLPVARTMTAAIQRPDRVDDWQIARAVNAAINSIHDCLCVRTYSLIAAAAATTGNSLTSAQLATLLGDAARVNLSARGKIANALLYSMDYAEALMKESESDGDGRPRPITPPPPPPPTGPPPAPKGPGPGRKNKKRERRE